MKCEKCGEDHDGSYGSGRFCSKKCSKSRSLDYNAIYSDTKDVKCSRCATIVAVSKASSSNVLCDECKPFKYKYTCDTCGNEFHKPQPFHPNRHIRCDECKRKVVRCNSDISSIMEASKRTQQKILKRIGAKCSICGWNESTCDIHHIIPSSEGGSDDHSNLIILCPNHHRIVHTTDNIEISILMENNLENMYDNWKDFYNTK